MTDDVDEQKEGGEPELRWKGLVLGEVVMMLGRAGAEIS